MIYRESRIATWGIAGALLSTACMAPGLHPTSPVTPTAGVHADARPNAPEPHEPPAFDARFRLERSEVVPPSGTAGSGEPSGFVGIVDTGWNPPDPHMAAGPDHVVMMTNGAIAFFQKDGTLTFEQPIEGSGGFWGGLGTGTFVFDPEVIYDLQTQRFFAMANERTGQVPYLLLAVSDDSNPNGLWHKYRFNVQSEANGDSDIDSPNIAVDEDVVYLTADFFGPDKYLIFMVEKAAVLAGASPLTTSLLEIGKRSFGLAVNPDGAPAQYMIEAFFTTSTSVQLYAILDPLTAPTLESVSIEVPSYQPPEDAPSLGTTERIETFDARFWSCMFRDGSLWATHHVNSSRIRQRWYEFDMKGWPLSGLEPELVQSGEIDGGADIRTFFGSIWTDSFGTTALVFARSSPSELISMARSGRLAGDPPDTTQPMEIVKDSTQVSDSDRWGDYSAVVEDPVAPGRFWACHEYLTGPWMTWIAPFELVELECLSTAACADLDADGIRDDPCVWWACEQGLCAGSAIVFADMGRDQGGCIPDGSADANDRFHALNCFSNQDTLGQPGYSCEDNPPQAFNVDAGGPTGSCVPDGVCDANDAFHAINAFEGLSTCSCPSAERCRPGGRQAPGPPA